MVDDRVPGAGPAASAAPVEAAAPGGESPEDLLVGATCALHEPEAASFVCARCGTFGCAACLFSSVREVSTCQTCADLGLGEPVPWERRKAIGNWRSFWATVRLASREPTRFFRTPTTHDSVIAAVVHGVLASTWGLLFTYVAMGVLLMLGGGATALVLEGPAAQPLGALVGGYGCALAGMSPIALLFGPANALMAIVIAAAAAHGSLALQNKATASFEQTLRVVSYSNAPYVWAWVPLAGSFSWAWAVAVEVIGLRETHKCGTDAAAIAAVVYRVVFLVCIVGAYVLLGLGTYVSLLNGAPS